MVKSPGGVKTTKDLTPNCILVDLLGGETLRPPRGDDKGLFVPGMILVLDEFGNLVLHDEAAESEEWERAVAQPEQQVPHDPGVPRRPPKRHPSRTMTP